MRVEVEAGSPESVEADVLAAPLLASEGLNGPVAALNGHAWELVNGISCDTNFFAASAPQLSSATSADLA